MREKNNVYKHLTEGEMLTVYQMQSEGKSLRVIGKWLGRSISTLSECLNYRPKDETAPWWRMSFVQKAEYQYRHRLKKGVRERKSKLQMDPELECFVITKLTEAAFSPEDVAYLAMQELGKKICAKTIYTYIKKENPDLKIYLLEEGEPRRQRITHRRGKLKQAAAPMRSILERPVIESEFGHFEGDLLQVRGGYFLSLRELKTRKQFFIPIRFKKAKLVRYTLIAFFSKLGEGVVKTITFDRGGEFAPSELLELERLFEFLQLYYCEAYKPYQKGSVENGHRWARKFIPRKSDFSSYSQEQVNNICFMLNQKPMKCLERKSSNEAWNEELKLVA